MTKRVEVDYATFLARTVKELAPEGRVAEQFITGSTAPFSGRSIPDLVFVPSRGKQADVPHIVATKLTSTDAIPDLFVMSGASVVRNIKAANPGDVRLAIAVSSEPTAAQLDFARRNDFELIAGFSKPEELAERIAHWACLEPSPDVLFALRKRGMTAHPSGKVESGNMLRIGKLSGGPNVYVDFQPNRGRTPELRHTNDGDVVVDVDATAEGVASLWESVVAAARARR